MSILGKFHEISFYSLISTIICLCTGKTTFATLWGAKLNVTSFSTFFLAFLFWACVLFIPHIAEEILGLFLTPFWFLIDLFRKRLDDDGKAVDYITYGIELVFFGIGILVL